VIYVIECVSDGSKEKYLESTKFSLFETDVGFKLPKLCLPFGSRSGCAVINGFIYVLNKDDGEIDRYDLISNLWKKCISLDGGFYFTSNAKVFTRNGSRFLLREMVAYLKMQNE